MESHSCSSTLLDWISDQFVSATDSWFCFPFLYIFPPTVLPSKNQDLLVLNMFASVCILKLSSGRWGGWGGWGSEDWKDVVMLKSTISICLSVRCLAWLSSTERWWWQNDKGGWVCTCHWMPIWLQSTISTEAPTCHENKNGAEVYGETKSHIYIKPTRSQHTVIL